MVYVDCVITYKIVKSVKTNIYFYFSSLIIIYNYVCDMQCDGKDDKH